MAFCPICRTNHDSNYPCCFNPTEEMLHDIGIEKKPHIPKEELKILEKKTDRDMLLIAAGVFLFIVALVVFVMLNLN